MQLEPLGFCCKCSVNSESMELLIFSVLSFFCRIVIVSVVFILKIIIQGSFCVEMFQI